VRFNFLKALCSLSLGVFHHDLDSSIFRCVCPGVAVVPGSSFFSQPEKGHSLIRFCFSKRPETLKAASDRLLKLQLNL
ncbi:MAG: hypothetical protein V7L08_20240, partial [Nostoc sp.]